MFRDQMGPDSLGKFTLVLMWPDMGPGKPPGLCAQDLHQLAEQAMRVAQLRATYSGTITQCGEQLCVKAPKGAPRSAGNSNYVIPS